MPEKKKKQSINLQYILRARRYLFIAISLAGVSVIMVLTMISPKVSAINALIGDLQDELEELEVLENKVVILNTVEEIDVFKDKDQIHAILPSTKPVLTILKQIEQLSAETSVIISEFAVSPGRISTQSAEVAAKSKDDEQKATEIIETEAVLVGRIENINAFLRGITEITPLTETSSMTLKSIARTGAPVPGSSEEAKVFEAGVALTSYFYTKELEATKPNTTLPTLKMDDELRQAISDYNLPTTTNTQEFVPSQVEGGGKENLFQ